MHYISRLTLTGALLLLVPSCNKGSLPGNMETYQSHGIIPLPLQADFTDGSLTLDSSIVISGDELFSSAINLTGEELGKAMESTAVNGSDTAGRKMIRFVADNSLSEEEYELQVSEQGIRLSAATPRGAYYAAQSLRQMIWAAGSGIRQSSLKLRCINIKDKPKYSWRGFHIDLSRHFFTKEYLLGVIDELSYYKINKLHLHLSDDQGWRVEIAPYPLLTETGAWRPLNEMDSACLKKSATDSKYTIDPRFLREAGGETIYGGYFTRQDIKDIVEYAGEHFIEVIPEIDMPGHMSAAIVSYPFLSCNGSTGWGKEFSYPVCPCRAEVMSFCHAVWDEIADMFPSRFVHIGGDEVDMSSWSASPLCQDFMIQNNLHNVNGLQIYFVSDIQHYMESKGKTAIAWDDVIDNHPDNGLIMMYWRDWVTDSPARCAANGNSIILSPWSPFYISGDHTDKTLKELYDYDPEKEFPAQVTNKVIGMQSCLWTEEIPSEAMFEYLVYPRMQALSEVEWGAGRDWTTFKIRLVTHLKHMSSKNIKYRRPGWV